MSKPQASDGGSDLRSGAGTEPLDDRLDRIVAEYAEALAAGRAPDAAAVLERVPAKARPGLERCLKMLAASEHVGDAEAWAEPLAPGMELDGFRLVRELGRGGMSIVWLANEVELKRTVAVKVLRPGLAVERRHADRFRREALATARLSHPAVVRVFSVGRARGHAYIAMEYVDGPSLASVLGALGPADDPSARSAEALARAAGAPELARGADTFEAAIARLLAPVADALAAAHEQGLVHRDVKPSNVMLRRDGTAVLCDFGLAKGGEDPALSLTGEPLGTPYYMSPEQAVFTETSIDHRTDVYSLGVTLYEALGGRRPFDGADALAVMHAIRTQLPPALSSLGPVSRDADAVVRRAMQRDPARRYATASDLHADLAALAESRVTRARTEEGGRLRRAWTQMRFATSGQIYEYRSARRLLGLPLVHVIGGPRPTGAPARVARGWLAAGGERAVGVVAMSRVAFGLFAFGGLAAGGFTWSGIGLGVLTFCGIGAGLASFAGISIGALAVGGIAIGHTAIGGMAIGTYAVGGQTYGEHRVDGRHHDEEAAEHFRALLPGPLEGWFVRGEG